MRGSHEEEACAKAIATVCKNAINLTFSLQDSITRTSEWLSDKWTFTTPFASAAAFASPCRVTVGTPASLGKISMSFIGAAAPLDDTPSDLKTASLPTQRAAKDASGEG